MSSEQDKLKQYVASCFILKALAPPKDEDGKMLTEIAADVAAHWAALGDGIAPFADWKAVRFVDEKPAHDLSHVGGIEAFIEERNALQ